MSRRDTIETPPSLDRAGCGERLIFMCGFGRPLEFMGLVHFREQSIKHKNDMKVVFCPAYDGNNQERSRKPWLAAQNKLNVSLFYQKIIFSDVWFKRGTTNA